MSLEPGQILNNRYRIVKLLGKGGFGSVYRAWDIHMDRPRALKENLGTTEVAQRQFKREAQILGDLTHPNLPKVIDHFIIPGQGQYLVMECVEGDDLQKVLNDRLAVKSDSPSSLPETQALEWIGQICDALSYLHSQNPPVIHRDIKPANIKIRTDGRAMLVDFGIAKVYDPAQRTTLGAQAVSPGYTPYEQYGLKPTDARSDIYALGATLYHLLTGRLPPESIERVTRDSLVPVEQLNPAISPSTAAAIIGAMRMDPEERFQSAAEFKKALTAATTPGAGQTPTPALKRGRSIGRTVVVPSQPLAVPRPVRRKQTLTWKWVGLAGGLALVGGLGLLIVVFSLLWWFPGIFDQAASETPKPSLTAFTQMVTRALLPGSPQLTGTPTLAPTLSPLPTIQPSAINTSSPGGQMALVPAGEFQMGSQDGEIDERPVHSVYLDDFYIDVYEVTNALFARFVDETSYQTQAEKEGWGLVFNSSSNSWEETPGADWRHPYGPASKLDGLENHPVVLVSWEDAQAYCQWAGGRLPTEAEWEKAARGTEARKYPWGDQAPTGKLVNFADVNSVVDWAVKDIDDGFRFTAPVGSYPAGASPYGLLDMAGNAWEWVMDWYLDTFYSIAPSANPTGPDSGELRVVRGGSWNSNANYVRSAIRFSQSPEIRYDYFGFRCARSP